MNSIQSILEHTRSLFARSGHESFSIRKLAHAIGIAPSVIYHYYSDKDALLSDMFHKTNKRLGQARKKLDLPQNASDMLYQRIEFQFDHAEEIVAVLKYYMAYRHEFELFQDGYLPDKSSLHIEEVVQYGIERNEFVSKNRPADAKVITHLINGYVLEYFPDMPRGKHRGKIVAHIHDFILRAISS